MYGAHGLVAGRGQVYRVGGPLRACMLAQGGVVEALVAPCLGLVAPCFFMSRVAKAHLRAPHQFSRGLGCPYPDGHAFFRR